MNASLQLFITQYLRVVLASLAPVILIAFMTIPVTLGGHADEIPSTPAPFARHMT